MECQIIMAEIRLQIVLGKYSLLEESSQYLFVTCKLIHLIGPVKNEGKLRACGFSFKESKASYTSDLLSFDALFLLERT